MNNVRRNFQLLVRQILKEELSKRVPEQNGNGIPNESADNKTFKSDSNSRDTKTKQQLLSDLQRLVKAIDDNYLVVWDDHDDLKIDARDLMSMRITPDWEDHYEIEVMTRNEDRVWVTGLDWSGVKEFVRKNMSGNAHPTYVEKAYDKSYRNRKDAKSAPDKGLSQDDKLDHKTVGTIKNKEKNYSVEDVKNKDDLPEKPMKEVGDFKRQIDIKAKDPVKLRKRTPDKKLVIKQT